MATVQIRVDDALKARVDSLYNSLGIDTTTAVRMFFMASLERDGIPFEVRHGRNAETLKTLDDVRNGRNLVGPFHDTQSLMEALNSDA